MRLGYFPNVTHAPAIVGVDTGIFQEALGENVELETSTYNAGTEAIEAGVYSCNGGSEQVAKTDLAVLSQSGQLEGSPDELKIEDFWYFAPLEAAKEKLGMSDG